MPRGSKVLRAVFEVLRRLAARQVDDLLALEFVWHRRCVDVCLIDDDGNDEHLVLEEALGSIESAVPFPDEESIPLSGGVSRDQRKKI
jgi:hypothetical protein